jgi:hypothetical protein
MRFSLARDDRVAQHVLATLGPLALTVAVVLEHEDASNELGMIDERELRQTGAEADDVVPFVAGHHERQRIAPGYRTCPFSHEP